MATAVKNTSETQGPSLFDRPAALSLIGVVYVVGCFGLIFKLVPYLVWDVLHLPSSSIALQIIVGCAILILATALLIAGLSWLLSRAASGARAGVFIGVVGVLLILLLTRWASIWIEYWSFYKGLFGPLVGAILTALVGIGLLVIGGYWFLQPKFEPFLRKFEEQGWFSAVSFKPQQGKWVRRGTIAGILIIVVAGVWVMTYGQGQLRKLPANWEINIPFTARVTLDDSAFDDYKTWPKDLQNDFRTRFGGDHPPLVVDRYVFRDFNSTDLANYVRVSDDTGSENNEIVFGAIVKKATFDKHVADLKSEAEERGRDQTQVPKSAPLTPIAGSESFASIQLLPAIQFTLPFLLLGVAIWGAWRIVNYPTFADFLIATEAELNKVSWTPRKKLLQDTVVVLVTVVVMAVYLFAMDQAWSQLLALDVVKILQIPKENSDALKPMDKRPW
jgi:preprotein translocase SecE subunit